MKTLPSNRAEKIFALLLRLYPRADREEFGDPMLQHFRDLPRDAHAAGRWPTLRFWIAIFLDTLAAAAKARIAQATQAITGKKLAMNAKTISFRKAFVGLLLPLLAGVAIYIYAQPKMYVGLTRLALPHPVANPANPRVPYAPYFLQTQFAILRSDSVFQATVNQLSLTDSLVQRAGGAGRDGSTATAVEFFRRRVSIQQQHRSSAIIEIRVASESSTEAAAIANQLAESYIQVIRHNRSLLPAPEGNSTPEAIRAYEIWQMSNNDGITILDRAQPGLRPTSPNIPLLLATGTLLSATLAAIGAALLRIALRLKPAPASD